MSPWIMGVNNNISRSGDNYFRRRCTEGCKTCITFVREDDSLFIKLHHEQSIASIWFNLTSDRHDSGKFRIQPNATNDKGAIWIYSNTYDIKCDVCSFTASI